MIVDRTYLLTLMLDNCLRLFNFLHFNRPLLLFLDFVRVRVQETLDSLGADSCYRVVMFAHSAPVHSHVFIPVFLNLLYSEICMQGWF